jgi:hypothetical protein
VCGFCVSGFGFRFEGLTLTAEDVRGAHGKDPQSEVERRRERKGRGERGEGEERQGRERRERRGRGERGKGEGREEREREVCLSLSRSLSALTYIHISLHAHFDTLILHSKPLTHARTTQSLQREHIISIENTL